MRKIVFWFLLGILFTANSVSGYTDDYIFFQNGDNNNGLSSQSVSSIVQDTRGFMWFGTQSGLNRFDGYEFKVYKKQPFNSNSLSNDKIQTLYMDENDVLWIGTYQGLCKFNIKTEIFTRYPYVDGDSTSLSNNVVISILKDSSGRLWVGTADGLNLFNSEKGSFKHYFYNSGDPNSLSNNVIRAVHEDYEGNIWVGTYGGINRYRDKTDDFISYQHDNNNPATIASNNVMVIKQVKERELWLGTWGGGGLSKLDTSTGLSTNYSLPDNRTYSLNMQNEDVIYVGTWGGGLIRYNPKEEGSKQYLHVANKTTSISHNIVYSMFKDKSGVFWIGTHGGGLNKMKETDNDFQFWTNNPNDPFSINSGRIDKVFIDSKGILWIGTYNGGLNRINDGMDRVIHYTHDPDQPGTISNDIINDISEDSRNNLLIATNSGLNRYNPLSDSFERWFSKDSDIPLPDQIVYALQEDTDGTLWVGTYNGGLMHYDYKKDKADYYANDYADPNSLSDNLVYKIFIDSYNNLWIGTNNGLNLFNRTTGNFIRYFHNENDPYSLTDSCIQTIFEDSNFNLWIGTASGGLNKLDRETGRFSHYMKEDGLPSNKILGILEDHEGLLWISTASNLTVFTPEDEYFQKVDEDDGIFAKEFAHGFSMGDRGENLYIGTTEGLYKISPGGFSINTYIPPVHLTSFRVFDEEVNYGKSLQEVDEFELSYNDKFIAFEFASLDFVNPGKNQYAYKMEGFDEEWIYSGNRRYASYTNLPFGKYTFRVKGSNNDGIWNEQGVSVTINMIPPPWRTPWAYLIYLIAASFVIYLIIQQFFQTQKHKFELKTQELDRERVTELQEEILERREVEIQLTQAKEDAEEANKSKSDFIANISHEIRTPMNAIIGYSNMISRESENPKIHTFLETIKRNSNQLLTLINDLLDLSSIEAGVFKVRLDNISLDELIQDTFSTFSYQMQQKNIYFEVGIESGTPEVIQADPHRLRQILYNLVGNALKFTEKGRISVKIRGEMLKEGPGDWAELTIEVSDTGMGISDKDRENIFKAFTQQKGQSSSFGGTGLGLAITRSLTEAMNGTISIESELQKGSVFTVYFPHVHVIKESVSLTEGRKEKGKSVLINTGDLSGDNSQFSGKVLRKDELLVWFNQHAYPWWDRISHSLFVEDWRDFASEILAKGDEFQSEDLLWYGEQLEKNISNFNIASLKDVISNFPDLIEAIRGS